MTELESIKDELSDDFINYLKEAERKDKVVAAYTDWIFDKLCEQELRLRKLESKQQLI